MKSSIKLLSLITFLFLLQLNAKATLVIHDWQKNHRGYSIELVPGTDANVNSSPAYVAAGTVYDATHPYPGWHFMYLDASGAIIAQRTSWAASAYMHEFRVVDIVAESNDKFWITIQARSVIPGFERDYIYIAGVDASGADLSPNPGIYITKNDCAHSNLYPTHSLFAEGQLYICGYAAAGSEYPNNPDKYLSTKYGMLLKCDVNSTPATTDFVFWNSGTNHPYDYDMALRMAPYGHGSQFPLLLTGAANSDGYYSNILVAKFDNNLNPIAMKGIHPPYSLGDPSPAFGMYGVDIRGGVFGGQGGDPEGDPYNLPDVVVLFNGFNEDHPDEKNWGLLRVRNDLQTYPGINSVVTISETSWATQFLQMHGTNPGNQIQSENHIAIVGQQYDYINNGGESCINYTGMGAITPSLVNINPFIATYSFGYSYWNYTAGFSSTPVGPFIAHRVYVSSKGTEAVNMDYYQGSLGAGVMLEDVTRLHTFSSLIRYYDNPATPNQYTGKIGMIAPIAESPVSSPSNNNLLTKFFVLDPAQQETSCDKYANECAPVRSFLNVFEVDIETTEMGNIITADAYAFFGLDNEQENISVNDCSGSYFKPGKHTDITDKNNGSISIAPNPATNELYADLSTVDGKYEFILTDIAGKVVAETSGMGGTAIKISLPLLSAGVYISSLKVNGSVYTEKVVIQ